MVFDPIVESVLSSPLVVYERTLKNQVPDVRLLTVYEVAAGFEISLASASAPVDVP